MKLGARILKTGIAITLSIYLAMWLGFKPPSMAAVAAAVAIQPSVYRSWRSILENIQGNLIGAIIATTFILLLGNHPIVIGIAVIAVIAIHLRLKLVNTITLSLVTVVLIMSGTPTGEGILIYALNRFLLIILGVISAFVINLVFMPPNYENKLYHMIVGQTTKLFTWVRLVAQHAPERATIKSELKMISDQKIKINQLYLWYKEERSYFKKVNYAKHRKIVIFRQMITTMTKLHELLRAMNENEHLYHQLPDHLQNGIQERLEDMMVTHERLLLRFNGKVKDTEEDPAKVFQLKSKLTDAFIRFYKDQDGDRWLHLFPLISAIIDYGHQIDHFDRLMDSFQSFHKKENKVIVQNEENEV
ncbi:aromatic acid exporter family protein [Camelliibacillus cellulosilyticus]|uniref:Aromatic acid exporter family protein n=1 Tax=Camelliibacillus cellulosilyticus TaxID=2174486 RepID=A0ABV9GLT0_9BACL